jgi:hypothetical protein
MQISPSITPGIPIIGTGELGVLGVVGVVGVVGVLGVDAVVDAASHLIGAHWPFGLHIIVGGTFHLLIFISIGIWYFFQLLFQCQFSSIAGHQCLRFWLNVVQSGIHVAFFF